MPKSLKLKLGLRADADFDLTVPTRRRRVVAGDEAEYRVRSTALTGYVDQVELAATGLPTGASESFSANDIGSNGSTVLTVGTTGLSAGTYQFTIVGETYVPVNAPGDYFWVSPTGAASWGDAKSPTPLSGAACCSLATANANVVAGDWVYLRDGAYNRGVSPANSGTSGNRITFQAYTGETPTITEESTTRRYAVRLQARSYVTVDGITSQDSLMFFYIGYGACYNEIKNCTFDHSHYLYSVGLISNITTAGTAGAGSDHNWIHDNSFSRYGSIGATTYSDNGTIRIGAGVADPSKNNTIEDNVFYYGGHDCFDVGGGYNVIRNNVFHNEEAYYEYVPLDPPDPPSNVPASGYFGNRNLILTNYGNGVGTANHTLVEGNRMGHAGTPPDDDGSMGIENAGIYTLARFNDLYNNGCAGYYSKCQNSHTQPIKSGSYARVYNNSIYYNGYGDASLGIGYKYGVLIWSYSDHDDWPLSVAIKNNIVYGNRAEYKVATDNVLPQITYENNFNTDPDFTDTTMTDKTSLVLPDLTLQAGSGAIGAGDPLTLASGSGTNSTSLTVDDSLYFQDGTWGSSLSDIKADWIAIGTVGNTVQISAVDYATRVITLASAKSWDDNAPVWLFKKSDGTQVLYGSAPEAGAHPYVS